MYHEMFPEVLIELQNELPYHQELMEALASLPADTDIGEKFALIGAYVQVTLADGHYDIETVKHYADIILDRLKRKRMTDLSYITH